MTCHHIFLCLDNAPLYMHGDCCIRALDMQDVKSGIVCINYIFIVVLTYHECVPFFCFVNFKNCFLLYLLKTSLLVRFALFFN